jgi:hypothetical protein
MAMNAHASLISTDGGLGVYDTTNNVTWTSNANLMATQAASYGGGSAAFVSAVIADSGGVIHDSPNDYDPSGTYTLSASDFNTSSGKMDYWGALAWVNYLNVTNYGGSNQWALPTTVDSDASGGFPDGNGSDPAQSTSQLAELFYGGLGLVAGQSITTTHNGAYALFSNLEANGYWSGTEYSVAPGTPFFRAGPDYGWVFGGGSGSQSNDYKSLDFYALAVASGQVSPVPLPDSAWLLASGLLGLTGLARRKAEVV